MKRNVNKLGCAVLVLCLLIALLPCAAFADSLKEVVSESAILSVTASVPDGGTLSYQWYSSTTGSVKGATAIKDANQASFTAPQTDGTMYYFCKVTSTKDERTSDSVNTTPVAVTFTGVDAESASSASAMVSRDDALEDSPSAELSADEEDSGPVSGGLILLVVFISLVVALLFLQLTYVTIKTRKVLPAEQ